MKRLKTRQRVDNMKTEVRVQKGSIGKWIYLGLLLIFAIWILDLFLGRYLYLKANGMVMRDTQTLSLSFNAQIQNLNTRDGHYVNEGDVIAQVSSMEIIEQLSAITLKITDLDLKISENQSQRRVIESTIDFARKRVEDMKKLRGDQEDAIKRGLVSTSNLSELLQDEFESRVKYREMQTQRQHLGEELKQLQDSRAELQKIHDGITAIYQNGVVKAPASGIVANVSTPAGSVVKPGDKILDVLYGGYYVLGYIDPGALYNLENHQSVSLVYGSAMIEGRVIQIYPLSTELPKEFQRTFRPLERSTVIRIELTEAQVTPPIFTTVTIYSEGSFISWLKALLP